MSREQRIRFWLDAQNVAYRYGDDAGYCRAAFELEAIRYEIMWEKYGK